jgi:hypothetical protein
MINYLNIQYKKTFFLVSILSKCVFFIYTTSERVLIDGIVVEVNKIPIYSDEEPNGEDCALNKFIDNVRQFIIDNNIYRDEDFDVLIQELNKKNKNKKNITKNVIEKTVLDIKNDLEN